MVHDVTDCTEFILQHQPNCQIVFIQKTYTNSNKITRAKINADYFVFDMMKIEQKLIKSQTDLGFCVSSHDMPSSRNRSDYWKS